MTKPPADIRTGLLWERKDGPGFMSATAHLNPDRHLNTCDVFWGSHGCCRPAGHEGDHWCDCCECDDHPQRGCVAGPPYYGPDTKFFGPGGPE